MLSVRSLRWYHSNWCCLSQPFQPHAKEAVIYNVVTLRCLIDELLFLQRFERKFDTAGGGQVIPKYEVERGWGVYDALSCYGGKQLSLILGQQVEVTLVVDFLLGYDVADNPVNSLPAKGFLGCAVETVEYFLDIPCLPIYHVV